MAQESQPPPPHGDPLQDVIEDNPAQRQSDAQPDAAAGSRRDEVRGTSDRSEGRGSTANGIPSSDEDAGSSRRRQYKKGADLVSGID
jgi:hypothetical protein